MAVEMTLLNGETGAQVENGQGVGMIRFIVTHWFRTQNITAKET